MFHVKNHKQLNIVDPWAHLSPKRRKLLDCSWAGPFRHHILPELPVESLRRHYHDCHGRPTKELYAMMGLILCQQRRAAGSESVEAMHRLLSLALDKVRAAGIIAEDAVLAIVDSVMGFAVDVLQTGKRLAHSKKLITES